MINYLINKRESIFFFLLLTALISFMMSYAVNSITSYCLLAFFFLDTKANIVSKLNAIKKNKIVPLYFLLCTIQFIGLIHTENLEYGLSKASLYLPMIFLPTILITEKIKKDLFKKLLDLFSYCLVVLFSYYLLIHVLIDQKSLNNFVLFIVNERLSMSQAYLVYLLFIALIHTLTKLEKRKSLLINGLLLLFFVFCYLLMSNVTSIVVLFIVFVTKILLYFREKSLLFKAFFITVFTTLILVSAYSVPRIYDKANVFYKTTDLDIDTIITKNSITYTKNSFEQRILINYIVLAEIKKALFFGVGTGDFKDVLIKKYKDINFKLAIDQKFNPHNQYFSEFLKTGVFGFVCFSILLIALLKKSSIDQSYYLFIVIFFVIGSFLESYLERQHGVFIFSFIIPFFLANKTN